MISQGGYNFTVAEVKSKLNDLGYYDKGNGVWKYSGGLGFYMSLLWQTMVQTEYRRCSRLIVPSMK